MALTDNILAYWKLDNDGSGGVSLVDSTGNGNTLTNNGGVALGTGIIDGDAVFNGGDYLQTDNSFGFSGDFTISIWSNPNFTNYLNCFFGGTNAGSLQAYFDSNTLQVTNIGGGLLLNVTAPTGWNLLNIVRSGGVFSFYINGLLVGTNNNTTDYSDVYTFGNSFGNLFQGQLDEIGVWSRALTANEVFNLYYRNEGNSYPFSKPVIEPNLTDNILAYWKLDNDGSGGVSLVDSTGNGHTLTNNNNVALGTGKIKGCGDWGTNADVLDAGTTFGLNEFTISAWVKFTASNAYRVIASEWDGTSGWSFFFGFDPDGKLGTAVTPNLEGLYSSSSIGDGNWHFVAMSYVPTTGKLTQYVDGIVSAETTYGEANLSASSANLTIGANTPQGVGGFNGNIDEVGIWNRALSAVEVTELYNGGAGISYPFVPPLYFNAAVDGNLATLGNWWQDSGFTTPADALPDNSSRVFITAPPTSGTATYSSALITANIGSAVSITANTITLNSGINSGTLIGSVVLNNSASNAGTVGGAAEFFDTTENSGTVEGNATFRNSSSNSGGVVEGNATIYNPSANPVAGVVMGTETYLWPNGTGLWGGDVWINGDIAFIIPQPSDVRSGVEYGPASAPYTGTYSGGNKAISISQLLNLPFPINI